MTTADTPRQSKFLGLLGLSSLGVTLISWVVAQQASSLDREILERLLIAFGPKAVPPEMLVPGLQWLPLQILILWVLSCLSLLAGYRLAAVGRVMVLSQLFVLMLLSQWALAEWPRIAGHPVAGTLAIFLGCLCGYVIRKYALEQTKYQSQYYELLLRNRELNDTKLQLVKQDEIERRMLAADLHDQVLNDLKAIGHKFDVCVADPESEEAQAVKRLLNQAMAEVREVMDSLCPSALEHLGLSAAIEDCLRRGGERAGFKGRLRSKVKGSELDVLSMVEQSLLYRLVQESITNICKHAQATTVKATLEMENEHAVIKIADDGKGIDPEKTKSDSRGLRYMRQRADLIGATIAWRQGEDGQGTVVEIRLDLSGRKDGQQNSNS